MKRKEAALETSVDRRNNQWNRICSLQYKEC